ncbi:MAG: pilus assembly protein TadG-related protein [Desulfobaccales bacterium]
MRWSRYRDCPPGERGSITPILALALVAVVGAMAVSIDLGQLFLVKNDIQNVADAAALAGAKKLLQDKLPAGAPDGIPEVYCDEAIQAAIDVANKNFSFGSDTPIKITAANVTIGKWNLSTKQFDRTGCSADPILVNAVQVTVNRTGDENPQVSTFFGSVLGVGDKPKDDLEYAGPTKLSVAASSVALLGLAGTSAIDLPFAVPKQYTAGQGSASNGFERMLERFAPAPAYAATKSFEWHDVGPGSFDLGHASFAVPTRNDQDNAKLLTYIYGPNMSDGTSGKRFPQIKVGDQIWGMSEWNWGSYIFKTFMAVKKRFNDPNTPKKNGKWRVTVPVFENKQVTAALPQNSWFNLASRLIPGVSQAYACTGYTTPVVYTQGFITIDITGVVAPTKADGKTADCGTGSGDQSSSGSCQKKCYMTIEVPLNDNTLSTDKGSNPIPYQKDYKDMFTPAVEIGVFASVPRLVK